MSPIPALDAEITFVDEVNLPLPVGLDDARAEAVVVVTGEPVAVPIADAVPVRITDRLLDTAILVEAGLAVDLGETSSFPGGQVYSLPEAEALPLGLASEVTDLAVWDGTPLRIGLADLGTAPFHPAEVSEAFAIGLGERAVAGVTEDWNVADDPTGVSGIQTWTRPNGTKFVVSGQQARISGDSVSEGLQVARCATDIATSDYEVVGAIRLQRNDGGLAASAVLARVAADGSAFYQARAIQWTGGDFVDLWSVSVAGGWQRIGYAAVAPQDRDELRLRVTGDPATLTVSLNGTQVIGPVADAFISSGTRAGISGEWNGGTQVVVGMDDWVAIPLGVGASSAPVPVADVIGMGLGTPRATLFRDWLLAEALALSLAEQPQASFIPKDGQESIAVGLAEGATWRIDVPISEPLPVVLEEAEQAGGSQPDSVPIGLVERTMQGFDPVLDQVAVGLAEGASIPTLTLRTGTATVAVGLGEAAVAEGHVAQVTLMQVTQERLAVAGPVTEVIGVAGPVNELIEIEVPL